jgi:hypothetical protein
MSEPQYPPGIKLYGEEKQARDRQVVEAVRASVDPATGRLRAAEAQQVYREVGIRFGLSPSVVAMRIPGELKPTNAETMAHARAQKGKGSASRPRRPNLPAPATVSQREPGCTCDMPGEHCAILAALFEEVRGTMWTAPEAQWSALLERLREHLRAPGRRAFRATRLKP